MRKWIVTSLVFSGFIGVLGAVDQVCINGGNCPGVNNVVSQSTPIFTAIQFPDGSTQTTAGASANGTVLLKNSITFPQTPQNGAVFVTSLAVSNSNIVTLSAGQQLNVYSTYTMNSPAVWRAEDFEGIAYRTEPLSINLFRYAHMLSSGTGIVSSGHDATAFFESSDTCSGASCSSTTLMGSESKSIGMGYGTYIGQMGFVQMQNNTNNSSSSPYTCFFGRSNGYSADGATAISTGIIRVLYDEPSKGFSVKYFLQGADPLKMSILTGPVVLGSSSTPQAQLQVSTQGFPAGPMMFVATGTGRNFEVDGASVVFGVPFSYQPAYNNSNLFSVNSLGQIQSFDSAGNSIKVYHNGTNALIQALGTGAVGLAATNGSYQFYNSALTNFNQPTVGAGGDMYFTKIGSIQVNGTYLSTSAVQASSFSATAAPGTNAWFLTFTTGTSITEQFGSSVAYFAVPIEDGSNVFVTIPDWLLFSTNTLTSNVEFEKFIYTNHHLPSMPPESEYKDDLESFSKFTVLGTLAKLFPKHLEATEDNARRIVRQGKEIEDLENSQALLLDEIRQLKNRLDNLEANP